MSYLGSRSPPHIGYEREGEAVPFPSNHKLLTAGKLYPLPFPSPVCPRNYDSYLFVFFFGGSLQLFVYVLVIMIVCVLFVTLWVVVAFPCMWREVRLN